MFQVFALTNSLRQGSFRHLNWFNLGVLVVLAIAPTYAQQSPKSHPVNLMTDKVARPAAAATRPAFVLAARDRQIVEELLAETRQQPSASARLKLLSGRLLDLPYLSHSLVGSLTEPEQLVTRLDGFDCVTFLETLLALNGAANADDFVNRLREWRYRQGAVSYASRLHYTTDWHRTHLEQGWLRDLTQGPDTVECSKTLNMVPGLPAQSVHFRYFPKDRLGALNPLCHDGDLIYFVSGRKALDTNHVGMLFRVNGQLMMRHASRSHQRVVEQPLADFVNTNQMLGFILARPLGR